MLGSAPLHSMVTSGMAPIVVSTNFAVSWTSCDFTWTVCVAPIFLAISRRLSQISEQRKKHKSCTLWCQYNPSIISKLLQRSCLPTPLIENDLEIFLIFPGHFLLGDLKMAQGTSMLNPISCCFQEISDKISKFHKRGPKSQQLSANSVLTIDTPYLTLCARYGVSIAISGLFSPTVTGCHYCSIRISIQRTDLILFAL